MSSKYKGKGSFRAPQNAPTGPQSKKALGRLKRNKKAAGEMLYKETEDLATTSWMNKIDAKPKDVSYLEKTRKKQVKSVVEDVEEEVEVTSSYDALLQSFQLNNIEEARRAIKKRKREGNSSFSSNNDGANEITDSRPRKKHSKLQEQESSSEQEDEESNGMNVDGGLGESEEADGHGSELGDSISVDEEDKRDRRRHEERAARIQRMMEQDSDIENGQAEEGEEENDDGEAGGDTEISVESDAYDHHYDHVLDAEELASLEGPTQFSELEKQSVFIDGSVWADARAPNKLPVVDSTKDLAVRPKVIYSWNLMFDEILKESLESESKDTSSPKMTLRQKNLFGLLNSYSDVLYCLRNSLNGLEIMSTYVLHIANHITKALERQKRSNFQIHELAQKRRKIKQEITMLKKSLDKKAKNSSNECETIEAQKAILPNSIPGEQEGEGIQIPTDITTMPRVQRVARMKELHTLLKEETEFRDQGFTKPKVLVLLPMKNSALEFVELLMKVMPRGMVSTVENRRKFYGDFFEEVYTSRASRPLEWLATFRGNTDDTFRLGISFRYGKTMKLYSGFYKSDIIVASPLGLRLAVDEQEQGALDYLSSIEMVVCDQSDVMLMQNWEHVQWVFEHLSRLPEKPREEIDFSRVRNYYLNHQAKYYRQSIIFSSTLNVDLNTLFNRQCLNAFGRYKIRPKNIEGSVSQVLASSAALRQVFFRLEPPNIQAIDDLRFDYFTNQVWEHMSGTRMDGTLIVIPSYFDYLRVQKFFRGIVQHDEINVVAVSEYTKETRGIKYRKHFYTGRAQIMIITERYHFYKRIRIRGIKNLIWYAPPLFPHYYGEIANWVEEGGSILTLYTKYDSLNMEGIVGKVRNEMMLTSERTTHSLST